VNDATSYYSTVELHELGLGSCGEDVLISRKASIYVPERVHVGDHVRIDDFVVITCGAKGRVEIGDHVHVAAHAALFGDGDIVLGDFVGVSGRTLVYSATDDYGGDVLTNPTVPDRFKQVIRGRVTLSRHVVLGAGGVVLPGVTIGEGSATGAMTLVNRDLEPWGIYVGSPARLLRPRKTRLLTLEAELRVAEKNGQCQG
jgi:dTDP-4-amino-4,6-dideoxy-D-glucose acyltransferase